MEKVVENNNVVSKMQGEGIYIGQSTYVKDNLTYVTYMVIHGDYDQVNNRFTSATLANIRSNGVIAELYVDKAMYKYGDKVKFDVEVRNYGGKLMLQYSNIHK